MDTCEWFSGVPDGTCCLLYQAVAGGGMGSKVVYMGSRTVKHVVSSMVEVWMGFW